MPRQSEGLPGSVSMGMLTSLPVATVLLLAAVDCLLASTLCRMRLSGLMVFPSNCHISLLNVCVPTVRLKLHQIAAETAYATFLHFAAESGFAKENTEIEMDRFRFVYRQSQLVCIWLISARKESTNANSSVSFPKMFARVVSDRSHSSSVTKLQWRRITSVLSTESDHGCFMLRCR